MFKRKRGNGADATAGAPHCSMCGTGAVLDDKGRCRLGHPVVRVQTTDGLELTATDMAETLTAFQSLPSIEAESEAIAASEIVEEASTPTESGPVAAAVAALTADIPVVDEAGHAGASGSVDALDALRDVDARAGEAVDVAAVSSPTASGPDQDRGQSPQERLRNASSGFS